MSWMDGAQVPANVLALAETIYIEIRSLTTKAKSDVRETEYFDHLTSGVVMLDGKTLWTDESSY